MAQRVVLHIGLMKSGTTYLQRLFEGNRDRLAERGVLFPGRTWGAQVRGVSEVMQRKRVVSAPPAGSWRALVDELETWSGTGVISMEYLGPAAPRRIAAVVSSFPSASLDVVVTARDLGRGISAMWQETVKNGRSQSFDSYVEDVAARRDLGRRFWREQDVVAIVDRWGAAVGSDRIALVTVPPPGAPSRELGRRFASVVGLDHAGLEEPGPANESLGAPSAEVLRLLNARLDDMAFGMYVRHVKQQLAKSVMARLRVDEPSLGFDPPPWLRERSRAMVDAVGASGIRVVGDLADLEPVRVPGVRADEVPVEDKLGAAVAAIEGLVRARARRRAHG